MFCHTLNTWLIAQLLHPLIYEIYFFYRSPGEAGLFSNVFFIFIVTAVFFLSIPSLFIARLFLGWLTKANVSVYKKLFIWIIAAEFAIFINFSGLLWLMDGRILMEAFDMIIPAAITAFLIIVLRIKQFFVFQSRYEINSTKNNLLKRF